MSSKKAITAISKVANEGSLSTLQNALKNNIHCNPSRYNPNHLRLQDGAIQRKSVQISLDKIYYSTNTDKVGLRVRPHQGVQSGSTGFIHADPTSDSMKFQDRIARIYMPQKKHVHNHPADKTIGKYWVIDFEPVSTFKSPLMQWTSATIDPFDSKGDNVQARFASVEAAVAFARKMGWGYDVQYPKFRNLTKKNYADSFVYKGEPKPEADYD